MVLHDGRALGASLQYGDTVVVYESRDAMRCVTVTRGASHRSKHGSFSHDGWVASRATFGSRVVGDGGRGYVHLLRPTPELWTRVLRHRTQILYAPDVANIVAGLHLRPGHVVLETGTGSGSLTTSLARAVAPHGRVFTFEFHAERAQAARDDFAQNKLDGIVTVYVRDTEATGFPEPLRERAHAVFLDLPGPHRAAASAAASLRPDGMLCSFSPCIEQVQRMCLAMAASGLTDMRTIEVLDREYLFARKPQMALPDADADACAVRATGKRPADAAGDDVDAPSGKRVQWTRPPAEEPLSADAAEQAAAVAPPPPPQDVAPEARRADAAAPAVQGGARRPTTRMTPPAGPLLTWPAPEARGHTGYLTFARKPVNPPAAGADDGAAA